MERGKIYDRCCIWTNHKNIVVTIKARQVISFRCGVEGKQEMGRIALEAAQGVLKFYNTYFAVKYPFIIPPPQPWSAPKATLPRKTQSKTRGAAPSE